MPFNSQASIHYLFLSIQPDYSQVEFHKKHMNAVDNTLSVLSTSKIPIFGGKVFSEH